MKFCSVTHVVDVVGIAVGVVASLEEGVEDDFCGRFRSIVEGYQICHCRRRRRRLRICLKTEIVYEIGSEQAEVE